MFTSLTLLLNRCLVRFRTLRVPAENLLLLVPHCLQRTECDRNIIHDIDHCERCGQCNVADLLKLRDEFGVKCNLASGGKEAVAFVRDPAVKVIVAVACEEELAAGIRASLPKPVVAIPNIRPHGPCKDTQVDVERVRATLESLVTSH